MSLLAFAKSSKESFEFILNHSIKKFKELIRAVIYLKGEMLMNYKKIYSIILLTIMLATLTACSKT